MMKVLENYKSISENESFRFWIVHRDVNGQVEHFDEILGTSPLFSSLNRDQTEMWIVAAQVTGSANPFDDNFENIQIGRTSINHLLSSVSQSQQLSRCNIPENECKIKRIIAHAGSDRMNLEFLVFWEGFSIKESTWEPYCSLSETTSLERYVKTEAPQLKHILNDYEDLETQT
jgi:hypothetical protein